MISNTGKLKLSLGCDGLWNFKVKMEFKKQNKMSFLCTKQTLQKSLWIYQESQGSDEVQFVSFKTIRSQREVSQLSLSLLSVVSICWALAAGTVPGPCPFLPARPIDGSQGFWGRSAQGEPIWALPLWCATAALIQEHWEALLCYTGGSGVNWLSLHRSDGWPSQLASTWQ